MDQQEKEDREAKEKAEKEKEDKEMKASGDISEMITKLKDDVKDSSKVETAEDVHTT